MPGLYIHVPFCVRKCRYCDFYSAVTIDLQREPFIRALCRELIGRAYECTGQTIETIYWGGGTPSLLTVSEIDRIMQVIRSNYTVAPEAEITIECNPGDLDRLEIIQIVHLGFNRFSIGAQSFNDQTLTFLGRRHDATATRSLVHAIRDAGVYNFSLDLIYGIPGTSLDDLEHDIDALLALGPTHISTYHLIYEEGTPLYRDLEAGRFVEQDEETSLAMSHRISDRLRDAGFEHYEISNYALPGYRSRHNSSYWRDLPYSGFGPGAHSYHHPWRSANPPDLNSYTRQLLTSGFLLRDYERITPDLQYEEYLLTGLRTSDGIDLSFIEKHWGTERTHALKQLTEKFFEDHLMEAHPDRPNNIRITTKGIDLSDYIISSLF